MLYLVITANHGMRQFPKHRSYERVYTSLRAARCLLTSRTRAYNGYDWRKTGQNQPVQPGYSGVIYELDFRTNEVTLIETRGEFPFRWLTNDDEPREGSQ